MKLHRHEPPGAPSRYDARRAVIALASLSCVSGCSARARHPVVEEEGAAPIAASSGVVDGSSEAGSGVDASQPSSLTDASSPGIAAALPRWDGPLSFLLITVDTLRPDLGYAGYSRPVSPNIDKLAERAVVYERAYGISTYTAFCLPPMMASRYPSEMPRTDRHEVKYLKSNVFLAERLRDAGYRTVGAASHFLFAPELGWVDGFDRFLKVPGEGDAGPGAFIDRLHSSKGLADATLRLLADPKVTSGPFFMWIHFLDPHKQYLSHQGFSEFGSDSRALYDGEIAYSDYHIGRVLDALARSPLYEHTAVVLTADHGEAFGEHGKFFHGSEVWDEIVRVPLIVFVPGAAPRHIARRISTVELAPTILELAGLPIDAAARGASFARELFGEDLPERPVLIDQPHNPNYVTRRAFIEHDYKLHHYPESQTYHLFDLSRDPGEQKDLAPTDPDALARMQRSYHSFMDGVPQVTPRAIAPSPPKPAVH